MRKSENSSGIRASIDIGSNTILLLIGQSEANNNFKEIRGQSEVTALGSGIQKYSKFSEESMELSFSILMQYKEAILKHNINLDDVLVTATEASRVAQNASEFFQRVKKEIGFSIHVISSEGEAYYSGLGVTVSRSYSEKEIVIMDIGGASTELVRVNINPFKIINSVSMPIGSVRAFDWQQSGKLQQKFAEVVNEYEDKINNYKTNMLVGLAGTMTSIGNMFNGRAEYIEKEVQGTLITSSQFVDFLKEYEDYSVPELLVEYPFLGKRAKTILVGGNIAKIFLQLLDVNELKISTYGLRHGTFIQGFINDEHIIKRF